MEASNGSFRSNQKNTIELAGLVTGLKRRGENLIFKLDDGTASINVIVFGERKRQFLGICLLKMLYSILKEILDLMPMLIDGSFVCRSNQWARPVNRKEGKHFAD